MSPVFSNEGAAFASLLQPNQLDGQPPSKRGLRLSSQRWEARGHLSESFQARPEGDKPVRAGAAKTESRQLVGSK